MTFLCWHTLVFISLTPFWHEVKDFVGRGQAKCDLHSNLYKEKTPLLSTLCSNMIWPHKYSNVFSNNFHFQCQNSVLLSWLQMMASINLNYFFIMSSKIFFFSQQLCLIAWFADRISCISIIAHYRLSLNVFLLHSLIFFLFLWWQIEVLNPDGTPAQGITVVVDPGAVQGLTSANGIARLSINTVENPKLMTVTVSFENCWNLIYLFRFSVSTFI